jgi:hypothetical protein
MAGILIRTPLYPHQRKALAFLLAREQDMSSYKACRKAQEKREARRIKAEEELKAKAGVLAVETEAEAAVKTEAAAGAAESAVKADVGDGVVDGIGAAKQEPAAEVQEEKPRVKSETIGKTLDRNGKAASGDPDVQVIDKMDAPKSSRDGNSLWEQCRDHHGKRAWKNRITGEVKSGKIKPNEGKGAILADDVSGEQDMADGRWVWVKHSQSSRSSRPRARRP